MTETGGAVVCAVASLFKGASGAMGRWWGLGYTVDIWRFHEVSIVGTGTTPIAGCFISW